VAYHFLAELLLLQDVSTSQKQHLQLTGAALAQQKFEKPIVGKVASDDVATLKVTELFSVVLPSVNVCLWRLHGCVLHYIHLSAMGVAEIAESTN